VKDECALCGEPFGFFRMGLGVYLCDPCQRQLMLGDKVPGPAEEYLGKENDRPKPVES